MELRHLRYFVAIAQEHGFVRAAGALHVAQPALSRQMRDLEREIGLPLLERDRRSSRLTPAGDAVLGEARTILSETGHAIDLARRSSRGLAGHCRVCAGKIPTWNGMVGRLLTTTHEDFPLVELEITEAVGAAQWRSVSSGKADLGIGIEPTREFGDLESQEIYVQAFDSALLPSGHPLASRSSIRFAELVREPIIGGFTRDSDHHLLCEKLANRVSPPTPIRYAESVADAFAQVAAGLGWTPFIRNLAAWTEPGTTVVPVEDLNAVLTMNVIARRGTLAAAVRTIRDRLVTIANGGLDPSRPTDTPSVTSKPTVPVEAPADDGAPNADIPLALELRHLRYFVTVSEEGSVGRAARRLSITQPTLSRQVRDLERMVGATLLERTARGVVPTAAGTAFASAVRPVLERTENVASEAHRATRGAAGRCLVATIPPAIVGRLIAALLRTTALELPEVRVGFVEVPTPQQPEELLAGKIDIGICHPFTSVTPYLSRVHRERLLDDAVSCALIARDHPLASRSEITLADLTDVPFLFMSRSLYPSFYDRIMTLFASHDFQPRIEQAYDGLQTTWSLARRGTGWCIGFRTSLRYPPAGLAAVPVRELDLPWAVTMLYRRDETRPIVLRMMDLLRRAAAAETALWKSGSVPSFSTASLVHGMNNAPPHTAPR